MQIIFQNDISETIHIVYLHVNPLKLEVTVVNLNNAQWLLPSSWNEIESSSHPVKW